MSIPLLAGHVSKQDAGADMSAAEWFQKRNRSELSHHMTVAILSSRANAHLPFAGYDSDHGTGAAAILVSYFLETDS